MIELLSMQDCPNEIKKFIVYCKHLGFTENPNYDFLKVKV